jgi:tetratricopeptide (TPR) repeat protein
MPAEPDPNFLDRAAIEIGAPLFAESGGSPDTVREGELLGPYRVVREVGRGGMARVYAAEDPRHERAVALKVLHQGIVTSVGRQRFLQEIKLAARLQHPHILPVFDSGESEGRLWYAMPYVRGETLRDRLRREPRLPIPEAIRIAREVALALDYAHREGVVHRDIKPANILLADGQALVADFGIARALDQGLGAGDDEGSEPLTMTGLAIGTPAYMSPEQAHAGAPVDGRSDLYSLAGVLYEMLAGEPPFSGPTAQAVLARRFTEPAPSARGLRDDVPESLDGVIQRALARDPADRFQSAAEFARALESSTAPPANSVPIAPPVSKHATPLRRRLAPGLALAALALLALGIATVVRPHRRAGAGPALDPALVAVLPFRVSATDSGLASLREGMVDLMHAKLTGEAGLRAVDPRAVLSAWQRQGQPGSSEHPDAAALEVGRRLGAGKVLVGSMVSVHDRLVLSAALLDARSGRSQAQASIEGPADSLGALVDRLSVDLLALHAGESQERLGGLGGYSWPVLQAYIAGRAAGRDGRYLEAGQQFSRALSLDSTFALAALAQLGVMSMIDRFDLGEGESEPERWDRASRLAWTVRDRLSPRDRSLLMAAIGPRYPAYSSLFDVRSAWEAAVAEAPDAAEIWANLADLQFHQGRLLGLQDRQPVVAAFQRAWMLDSTYAFPLEHLIDLAADAGDTARVRALSRIYLDRHPNSELADYIRWRAAQAMGDRPALAAVRARIPQMSLATLQRIVGWSQLLGYDLTDADLAARAMLARAGTQAEVASAITEQVQLLANRGHLREATRHQISGLRLPQWRSDYYTLTGIRFYGGDTAEANTVATRLERDLLRPLPPDSVTREIRYQEGCVVAQWRVSQNDTTGVAAMAARLRHLAVGDAGHRGVLLPGEPAGCVTSLEATVAVLTGRPNARSLVDRQDSILRAGTMNASGESRFGTGGQQPGNLEVAHLLERLGDYAGALAVVRRRLYNYKSSMLWYLPTYLEQEAKLAAATGDRTGAIRAYRHYLTLMAEPDSAYLPAVREARAQVAKLVGEQD